MEALAAAAEGGPFAAAVVLAAAGGPPCTYDAAARGAPSTPPLPTLPRMPREQRCSAPMQRHLANSDDAGMNVRRTHDRSMAAIACAARTSARGDRSCGRDSGRGPGRVRRVT